MAEELGDGFLLQVAGVDLGLGVGAGDEDECRELGYVELLHRGGFLVPDLGDVNRAEEVDCQGADQRACCALLGEQDGLGSVFVLSKPFVQVLVCCALHVVGDAVDDGVDDTFGAARALVVLDARLSGLFRGCHDFQCGEALDTHLPAEGFIFVIVAVDRGDFRESVEVFRGFFVGRFEVLAMAAPGRVESKWVCE